MTAPVSALPPCLMAFSNAAFLASSCNASEDVTLSVKCFLILPDILRASDMVAVLPSRLVAGMNGFVVTEPPLEIPGFTKTAVWHERTHHDLAQRWLRELLFTSCTDRK